MGETPTFFNEMDGTGERPRAPYARYCEWFEGEPPDRLPATIGKVAMPPCHGGAPEGQ